MDDAALSERETTVDTAAFVERFRRAWSARDPQLLGALFRPDALVRQPPVPRAFRGREVSSYFEAVFAAMPDLRLEPTAWAASGNTVMIEWTITASSPQGELRWSGVDRFRLDGDLATDEAVYFDTQPLWAAIDPSMRRDRGLIELG